MDRKTESKMISVCADLLMQNSKIHFLSAGITIAAIISILIFSIFNLLSVTLLLQLLLVITLGIAETIMSIRTGFDAALLRRLCIADIDIGAEFKILDEALVNLRLISIDKTNRYLGARLKGCMTIFKMQIIFCVIQIIAITCFAVTEMYLLRYVD